MKHLDDMEELFQNRFADFDSEPADDAWEKIQEQLTPLPKATQWTPKVYREGVLALLLLLGASWFFLKNNKILQDTSVEKPTNQSAINENKNADNQLITKNNLTQIEKEKAIYKTWDEEKNQNNTNEILEKKEKKTFNTPTLATTQNHKTLMKHQTIKAKIR